MEYIFKYKMDGRTKVLSAVWSFAVIAAVAAIFFFTPDAYMRAWLLSIFVAVLALYLLSIPRYIRVNNEVFEIHCVVEMTSIRIDEISSVGKVSRDDFGKLLLTLGSYGFFGYYGYYYSTRYWESVKMYAGRWGDFVEIEDIFEQKYIVSCESADNLIAVIEQAKLHRTAGDPVPELDNRGAE